MPGLLRAFFILSDRDNCCSTKPPLLQNADNFFPEISETPHCVYTWRGQEKVLSEIFEAHYSCNLTLIKKFSPWRPLVNSIRGYVQYTIMMIIGVERQMYTVEDVLIMRNVGSNRDKSWHRVLFWPVEGLSAETLKHSWLHRGSRTRTPVGWIHEWLRQDGHYCSNKTVSVWHHRRSRVDVEASESCSSFVTLSPSVKSIVPLEGHLIREWA